MKRQLSTVGGDVAGSHPRMMIVSIIWKPTACYQSLEICGLGMGNGEPVSEIQC